MPDNYDNDPYVGKIVKINDNFSFDYDCEESTGMLSEFLLDMKNYHNIYDLDYSANSLFLVVGIKDKKGSNCYILKPLNKDDREQNINKKLIWARNEDVQFQIVD